MKHFIVIVAVLFAGCAAMQRPHGPPPYMGETEVHEVAYKTGWGIADGVSYKQLPGRTIAVVHWEAWHDGHYKTVTLVNDKVVDITIY